MSFITKKHLSRRTFLRGAGVAWHCLCSNPWFRPRTALAQTAANPRTRFGAIYVPHGATMYEWTPEKDGTGFRVLRNSAATGAISRIRSRSSAI